MTVVEQIDAALTLISERTMMDVSEVSNILLDLRLTAMNETTEGETTDGIIPEGLDALVGASDITG